MAMNIRPIQARDDAIMASIIRTVMPEFGAIGSGFAINDPEVDWLSRAYAQPRCAYFVIEKYESEMDRIVVGGAGVAPLVGGDDETCELRKMYFLHEARGAGAGAAMMAQCLATAQALGFRQCYLETLGGMDAAMKLYERSGFARIAGPMGATGHGGCNAFYLRSL
jgi:putative acetyltransferase